MTRLARPLGGAAVFCWAASWFLPVIEGYPGWAAFRAALTGPFRDSFPVRGDDAVPQLLSALTNVVFVALIAWWLRSRIGRPAMFLKIAIACLLLDLYWLVEMLRAGERDALLVGYYTWIAAFALLVALGISLVVSDRQTSRTPRADMPA